jgi:hypothetical protein
MIAIGADYLRLHFWNPSSLGRSLGHLLEGVLGAMALLAAVAALSRYAFKRLDASFKLALLAPPCAAVLLMCSLFFRNTAAKEFATHYVGVGVHPGAAFALLAIFFLFGAVAALAFGLMAALGLFEEVRDSKGHISTFKWRMRKPTKWGTPS